MSASTQDKSIVMSLGEPIIVGQTVLVPGTYVWKLLDSTANRHIVEIEDQKTGHIAATILALPAYREEISQSQLEFWETPAGLPRAVRTWFYPGDDYGQEFEYPGKLLAMLGSLLAKPAPAQQEAAVVLPPAPKKTVKKHATIAPATGAPTPQTSADSEDSWATASFRTGAAVRKSAPPVRHSGFWDRIRNLPLTATLAPLIGLLGVAALVLFAFISAKRKMSKGAAT